MPHNPEDVLSVCNFLKQTPEGNLRKMLVGGELTENHFRILMKLAKGGPEEEFVEAFNSDTMGKLRLSTKELPLKEKFWTICKSKISSMGLIGKETPATKQVA